MQRTNVVVVNHLADLGLALNLELVWNVEKHQQKNEHQTLSNTEVRTCCAHVVDHDHLDCVVLAVRLGLAAVDRAERAPAKRSNHESDCAEKGPSYPRTCR